ncbi:flagellar basal body P-ring formation chaperone FlgA [uncultured Litoreibacter sp.]|uniref:flagellar basal body P-ring formation chaperone FlgA n=1 Tax=uncultured Litoreibacter sp. TaxID=1392394 RepID=UPI0034455104
MRRAFNLQLSLLVWAVISGPVAAQTLVPSQTLRPGHLVTATDVMVSEAGHGAFTKVSQVVGLEVQRVLYRGRPIQAGDLGAAAVVQRNQIVTLIFQTGAISIATEGRSLGRGAVGDKLRVLNLASKNTVVGRVSETGDILVNQE